MPETPWPEIPEGQEWAIELFEQRLGENDQTSEELVQRASELRAEAAATDVIGIRDAALALAQRYQELASSRVPSA